MRLRGTDFRMKCKFEDYCRLHSIITNVSTKDIWACLRDGRDLNELLENTPDEFDEWVRHKITVLRNQFKYVETQTKIVVDNIKLNMVDPTSKKEFAEKIVDAKIGNTAIAFKMYDGKQYDHIIWRMIEPKWSKPFFKQNDEDVD
jgi:RNA ligase